MDKTQEAWIVGLIELFGMKMEESSEVLSVSRRQPTQVANRVYLVFLFVVNIFFF